MQQISKEDCTAIKESAVDIANFLKVFGHRDRFRVLAQLCERPTNVQELEKILGLKQTTVSQIMSRLRLEGLVTCEKDGVKAYYAIADENVVELMTVFRKFCE